MVRSLGSFADGKSNVEDWPHLPWDGDVQNSAIQVDDMALPIPRRRRRTTSSIGPSAPLVLNQPQEQTEPTEPTESLSPSLASHQATSPESLLSGSAAITPASELLFDPQQTSSAHGKTASSVGGGHAQAKLSPEVKALFTRAANMMREATEADGAVFFDAQVSTFGGLVDDEFVPEPLPESTEEDHPCTVLGMSTAAPAPASPDDRSLLYEAVLRHLLRTYPHGMIFNFDDDMAWSSHNSGEATMSDLPTALSETLAATAAPLKRPDSAKSQDDENLLREAFPSARTLVLYPLWAAHRDRWFAGAVIWSSDPMRVFTNEQELSYLAAMSNSIMAEVARLDIKLADAAKGDFISSISHELRSPLHGILGCCELLKDTDIDNFQSNMAQTIETCGKTLLDTINHVSLALAHLSYIS